MYEVTCRLCGIRERFTEKDEAVVHAYNHERVLTHVLEWLLCKRG